MKTTKEVVENIVWKACDTFRGSIDSSVYKDYILSMLFVKYLSDFVKEKTKELREKYKGNEGLLSRMIERLDYKISETANFDYLYSIREENNIGERINTALREIEKQHKNKKFYIKKSA